jgi:hypothetical protein
VRCALYVRVLTMEQEEPTGGTAPFDVLAGGSIALGRSLRHLVNMLEEFRPVGVDYVTRRRRRTRLLQASCNSTASTPSQSSNASGFKSASYAGLQPVRAQGKRLGIGSLHGRECEQLARIGIVVDDEHAHAGLTSGRNSPVLHLGDPDRCAYDAASG